MARGNQRDKAREANQKKMAAQVSPTPRPATPQPKPDPGLCGLISLGRPQTLNRPAGRSFKGPSCPPGRPLPALPPGRKTKKDQPIVQPR